jgi:hypothetical protein
MLLTERYKDRIRGVLSCYDRVVIRGTLPGICYAEGMTAYLHASGIRIFDYPKFANSFREKIRETAESLAREHDVEIEFVRNTTVRKESLVAKVLETRGEEPGLVHILSAMETCQAYRPWHDKKTGKTSLKSRTGKCLHYYFYFVDPVLGLCYLRVPTWCPFRLQFYFNGHNYLATRLREAGIDFRMLDNAFAEIADFPAAQRLSDELDLNVEKIHERLDYYARLCCPVMDELGKRYPYKYTHHWSLMQVEYATDMAFRRQSDLGPLYEVLSRTAIHAVKPENVATFLGRKLVGQYRDELGNRFDTRIQGTRIKHHMGSASIKIYDKFNLILRIETTANDVSFFKHHRKVEHRNGGSTFKLAPVRKTIYSLNDLRELLGAANRRYLEFISDLADPTVAMGELRKISEPRTEKNRKYKGFNLFSGVDQDMLLVLLRGEHNLSGFRNSDLRKHLPQRSSSQISRLLKRLRLHGLTKRVGRSYKYYLTKLGRRVLLTAAKVKELVVIPQLAGLALT